MKKLLHILLFLPLVAGCAGVPIMHSEPPNPVTYIKFLPFTVAKYKSLSEPAKVVNEIDKGLYKRGYAKIGHLTVEHVTERCTYTSIGSKLCRPVSQQNDSTRVLLTTASSKGGELVTLSSDNLTMTKNLTRGVCNNWININSYRYVYNSSNGSYHSAPVITKKCAGWKKIDGYDIVSLSTGVVWRQIKSLSNVQRDGDDLTNAAFTGDIRRVKELVAKRIDVNTRNVNGLPPLIQAAKMNRIEVMKYLLAKGADVNISGLGGTPLSFAAKYGRLEAVKLLLNHGADPNAKGWFGEDEKFLGATPLFSAVASGNLKIIKLLTAKGADVNARSNKGYTPLMMAANKGQSQAVTELISLGANVNAKTDAIPIDTIVTRVTPLVVAIIHDDVEIVRILLLAGANPLDHPIEGDEIFTKNLAQEGGEVDHLFSRYSLGGKGFENKSGKIVITPRFDQVTLFSEGLSAVRIMNTFGYINRTGRLVIPAVFDNAHPFSNGLALVQGINGKWGWINKRGKFVIPATFSDVHPFRNGLALVKAINGKWGLINKRGRFVIPARYDSIGNFSEGLAAVLRDRKWRYMDRKGREVIELKYDAAEIFTASIFSEGMAKISIKDDSMFSLTHFKSGYIDKRGKFVIKPLFNRAGRFKNGLAPVGLVTPASWTWRYIDKTGNYAFDAKFNYAGDFHDGLAEVKVGSVLAEKWGFIDPKGNFVIKPEFEKVLIDFEDGIAMVVKEGHAQHIDKTGAVVKVSAPKKRKFSEGLAIVTLYGKSFLAVWKPPVKIKAIPGDKNFLLVNAIASGNEAQAAMLIRTLGADVRTYNDDGNTVLMLAAMHGMTNLVSLLLKKGAPVDAKSRRGETALMFAVKFGRVGVIKRLLAGGAIINIRTYKGTTLLSVAANAGHFKVVSLLLDKGAMVGARSRREKFTALMAAADGGHVEIIQLLLKRGAVVNNGDYQNLTALVFAAVAGRKEAVITLLSRGADPEIKSSVGRTADEYAEKVGFSDLAELIKKSRHIQ